MTRQQSVRAFRAANLIVIALILVGLSVTMVAWRGGQKPEWTGIALPLVILMNGFAGLEVGPFRSTRFRMWFSWASAVASLYILVVIVMRIVARHPA